MNKEDFYIIQLIDKQLSFHNEYAKQTEDFKGCFFRSDKESGTNPITNEICVNLQFRMLRETRRILWGSATLLSGGFMATGHPSS